MNHYLTSKGERVSQSTIDYKTTKAKGEALMKQVSEHGYNFCESCGISSGTYLDCSHDISVKRAKEAGQTEQCWNVGNITILCRKCHQEKDKLNFQFTL